MANLSTGKFLVMYGVEIQINTAPTATTAVYATIGDGITNVSEALNEVKQQMYYLINKGFGQTEITAMHPSITFTGNRLHGDTAQDYIFGLKYALGSARKTDIKIKVFDPEDATDIFSQYTASVTVTDIQELSGATENGSDISFTLEFNGAPEVVS
jgi:hypothetical protein